MDYQSFKKLNTEEAFKVAADYSGVPADVLDKVWAKESSRGKNMLSGKGAMGHFQQMPDTLKTWQERLGQDFDPNNFHDGLFMAMHHFKENMGATKGNIADALRMYNSGTDRKRWDNPETNAYVNVILGDSSVPNAVAFPESDDVRLLTARASDVRREMATEKKAKEVIGALDKVAMNRASMDATIQAQLSGGTLAEATDYALEAQAAAKANPQEVMDKVTQTPLFSLEDTSAIDALAKSHRDMAVQIDKNKLGVMDKIGAVYNNLDTVRIVRALGRENFQVDPSFKYMDNIDEIEKGYTGDEIDRLREARSAQHLEAIKGEIDRERKNNAVLFSGGAVNGFLWSLAGGVADPTGWAAGLGTAKAFQLAGIGSRALAAAGRTGAATVSLGGEAALGNVLLTGTLQAAGEHITLNDYAASAGAGLVLGSVVAPWALKGAVKDATQQQLLNIERNAADAEATLWAAAQARAGTGATTEQIKQAADAIQAESIQDLLRVSLASVPEGDQILARVDMGAANAPVHTADDIVRLGLDASVSDVVQREMVAEMIVRAERFVKQNGLENIDQKSFTLDMVGLESTAAIMLRSKSPVTKMAAAVLLESTTGAGGRRRTAALSQAMRERVYIGNVMPDYDAAYKLYRGQHGGTAWDDAWDGKIRAQFDREVAMMREASRSGSPVQGPPHPAVARAAKLLDDGYDRMRIEQQYVGTVGASRLGQTSVGYMPHQMSPARVLGMDSDELRALHSVLSRQFQERLEFDKAFSDQLAVQYTERMRQRAQGTHQSPVNITNPYAGDMIRDSLEAMNIPHDRIAEAMGRFSRGGAGHTKQRLDLDLNEEFIRADGSAFKLIDLFNTDQMDLYRSYARRASAEVALAQYGIMGQNGTKLLRNAMEVNGASIKELEAFDQVVAEFLNQPFGSATPPWMDNARVLTSLSRLGGMGFTQFGEYANGMAAVGVMRTFKAIAALPRMLGEIRDIKKGQIPNNPILNTLDLVGGIYGGEPYKMVGLYDVADNAVQQYGRESVGFASRVIRAGGNLQARLSMHRAMATAQTRSMAEQIVHKAVRFTRNGVEDKALSDMGISEDVRKWLKADMKNIAKFEGDTLVQFDLTKTSDPQRAAEFVQAVQRGASQIIQHTYIGETGKWAHNAFLKMLTQFRSFPITAVEKQWGRQAAVHGAAKAAGLLLGAMSFAVPLHLLRTSIAAAGMDNKEREEFLDRRLSPYALGMATLNYASMSGYLSDILNFSTATVDAVSGGSASEALGRNPRGSGGGFVDQVVPAAGWVNDVFSGNPHKVVKALPFSNLPFVQPFINLIK